MREREVELYFKKRVKKEGGLSFKWSSPSHRGVPDQIAMFKNKGIYFVEIKSDTGRLSALQEHVGKELSKHGCRWVCLYGKKDVDKFFKELGE